jgi:GNAT superfamily N-acetyltransferase
MDLVCFECQTTITAQDLGRLGDALVAHARSQHDWPYSDQAIRNFAEATQRLTGPGERLESIGGVTVQEVTEERIDDWFKFFDHDAFVGMPEWAACYCLEPHVRHPSRPQEGDDPSWRDNREAMASRLKGGSSVGYLAYVDGKPAGWVNASMRSTYSLYQGVDPGGPEPERVIGVSCFIVAPPYRQHGLAEALLDRVIEDGAERGAQWVEAYPFNKLSETDAGNFRGPRSMYDSRGFETVEVRDRDTVVRRPI